MKLHRALALLPVAVLLPAAAPEPPTMARTLADARRSAQEAGDALQSLGAEATALRGSFVECDEANDGYAPQFVMVLDSDAPIDDTTANAITALLVDDGWERADDDAAAGGWPVDLVDPLLHPVALHLTADEDDAELQLVTTGVCLPSSGDEQVFYEAMGVWTYDVETGTPAGVT